MDGENKKRYGKINDEVFNTTTIEIQGRKYRVTTKSVRKLG